MTGKVSHRDFARTHIGWQEVEFPLYHTPSIEAFNYQVNSVACRRAIVLTWTCCGKLFTADWFLPL